MTLYVWHSRLYLILENMGDALSVNKKKNVFIRKNNSFAHCQKSSTVNATEWKVWS